MTQTRREFLGALGTAVTAASLSPMCTTRSAAKAQSAERSTRRPNILFVMVDEMPWDTLGYAGHPTVRTPNLDALAGQGVRFSRAYTVAPICRPARWSAFTSRYAHVHGVIDNKALSHDGEILLTSILKHAGYDTAVSGKLHYVPKELAYDFDDIWSYHSEGPHDNETYAQFLRRKHGSKSIHPFVPGTQPFPDDPLGQDIAKFPYPKEDFMSYWITDRSIDYLRARKGSEKPWFLFASYRIPHTPYHAPDPYWSMYDPRELSVPEIPEEVARGRPAMSRVEKRHTVDSPEMLRALTAQFLGHVTNADDNIGRLLGELKRLEMEDDTIVVLTSDHGNMLGERGLYLKGVMYERSTHVPLIVRAPAGAPYAQRVNTGREEGSLIEIVDIAPTLLAMAGLDVPEGFQGRSFLPLLLGQRIAWKDRCFAERHGRMVRTPKHKLIELKNPLRYELYDLENDPRELRDLAAQPEHRELVAQLTAELNAWGESHSPPTRIEGMSAPEYSVLDANLRRARAERMKTLRDED